MQTRMQHYTLVIRKHPTGYHYLPFDPDPDAEEHRHNMIAHLVNEGHAVERIKDHPELGDHVRLHSGPLSHKGK